MVTSENVKICLKLIDFITRVIIIYWQHKGHTASYSVTIIQIAVNQGVALTGRNTTGPPCSRGAIIRLEAA